MITQGKYELPDVIVLAALGIVAVIMSWLLQYVEGTICHITVVLLKVIV